MPTTSSPHKVLVHSEQDPQSSTASSSYGTFAADMEGAEDKGAGGLSGYESPTQAKDSAQEEYLVGIRDAEGTTLYEKKCMVVNKEIDRMGMGKYQWCIWGLCGFGYLLDLMWAQAFGLVLGPLQQEFGFDSQFQHVHVRSRGDPS